MVFTWTRRKKRMYRYGIPLIGMSMLATEDGVQNIIAGGGKVMLLSSGHGCVEANKNAADWYKTMWLVT